MKNPIHKSYYVQNELRRMAENYREMTPDLRHAVSVLAEAMLELLERTEPKSETKKKKAQP